MPDEEIRVDPAALVTAARRVEGWSDALDDHTSALGGQVTRGLEEVETTLDGSALGDAVGAVAVAVTRAGDGLVTSLRGLGERLEDAAARYEQADRASSERLGEAGP